MKKQSSRAAGRSSSSTAHKSRGTSGSSRPTTSARRSDSAAGRRKTTSSRGATTSGRRTRTAGARASSSGTRTSSSRSRANMMGRQRGGSASTTTDHNEIQRWAESRGGVPACVKKTGGRGDMGVLRIDFPGRGSDASLQKVSWDEWFRKFDSNDLAFLYQENTATGRTSRFNKLVSRQTAANQGTSRRGSRTRTAGGHA